MSDYDELEVYDGPSTACENCGRDFTPGEVVSQSGDLLFCYSDARGGCVLAYCFRKRKPIVGSTARYRTATLPPAARTPNYVDGIVPIHEDDRPGFWQRLKAVFR